MIRVLDGFGFRDISNRILWKTFGELPVELKTNERARRLKEQCNLPSPSQCDFLSLAVGVSELLSPLMWALPNTK